MSEAPNNVRALPGANLPADQVLRCALEAGLEGVVVIGWRKKPDEEGNLFYAASSYGQPGDAIYAVQQANLLILELSR